jgi:hypothetical protein
LKRNVITHLTGVSGSGAPHGLLIEEVSSEVLKFTVTGADGKKRHASLDLSDGEVRSLVETLSAALAERETQR